MNVRLHSAIGYITPADFLAGRAKQIQLPKWRRVRYLDWRATGLEPATSGVTGRRSNRLNYDPRGNT